MSDTLAPVVGAVVCCLVPIGSFMAGIFYARYGVRFRSPIAVGRPEFAEEE